MDWYLTIKVIHIISSTVLFGTGLGIAFFMFRSHFSEHVQPVCACLSMRKSAGGQRSAGLRMPEHA